MKKLILLIVSFLLIAASSAWADFTNGGFEDGSFNGWTRDGGSWYGGLNYNYNGDPGKSAIVSRSMGTDSYTNGNLSMVPNNPAYGDYAARVNNYDWNYHFSTLEQTQTWNADHIYFAWAAVLENPNHDNAGHFSIELTDQTNGNTLYSKSFDYYSAATTPDVTWLDGITGWKYSPWTTVDIDTSGVKGDILSLKVLASDCAYGGHGGYAYVDGFSQYLPPNPTSVPEPGTLLLLGSGLAGLGLFRRKVKKASA